MMKTIPSDIKLLQKPKILELHYDDDTAYRLPCAYLRAHSPSADNRQSPLSAEEIMQAKSGVNIIGIEPVGNYGVKLKFDDGHATGIYHWDLLHRLATEFKPSSLHGRSSTA